MSKVVIITGATGGLGSAIALRFAKEKYRLVVNYKSSLERAEALADQIRNAGAEVMISQADVTKYSEVRQMVQATVSRWGCLDVLVANAGGTLGMLGRSDKYIIDYEETDWDLSIGVNLTGAFNSIKAAAEPMLAQRNGHIVVVASATGFTGLAKRAGYAAAKAGVVGLMKVAAREFGEYNVKVNAVSPGLILHERIAEAMLRDVPHLSAIYSSSNVLHREKASAVEFADFIFHLTGMENISAQTLNLDSQILF
jgi:3-oxoacyl-[acyl-carrier protein] reductase